MLCSKSFLCSRTSWLNSPFGRPVSFTFLVCIRPSALSFLSSLSLSYLRRCSASKFLFFLYSSISSRSCCILFYCSSCSILTKNCLYFSFWSGASYPRLELSLIPSLTVSLVFIRFLSSSKRCASSLIALILFLYVLLCSLAASYTIAFFCSCSALIKALSFNLNQAELAF